MSSEDEASPISIAEMQKTYASIPNSSFSQFPVDASPPTSAALNSSAPKRPFLKRGSRMPISKIPEDPFTSVVKPIQNPQKPERVHDSTAGAHDLDRSQVFSEDRPASSSRVSGRARISRDPISVARPATRQTGEWDKIAAKNTEDLESYLRNIGGEGDSFLDAQNSSQVSTVRPIQAVTRRQKSAAPSGTRSDTVDSIIYGRSLDLDRRPTTAPQVVASSSSEHLEEELRSKLRELDSQIEKFKKENEYCKKLRLEREAALGDAQRYKERALKELEAAEKDIDEQRSQVVSERKRLQQDKERGRSMVTQLRELQDENKSLKEHIEAMELDFTGKTKKLKNEIVRLNSLVSSLEKSKTELEVEVRALANSNASPTSLPASKQVKEMPKDLLVSSNSHPDGRIDRSFADGRREAIFPSGLRKSVWQDGSALVNFPNGDVKETSATGIVTYRYAATGCVQKTHPDGLEVLEFASGQVETHFPNGTKEIVFPNKMVKRIDLNGLEALEYNN